MKNYDEPRDEEYSYEECSDGGDESAHGGSAVDESERRDSLSYGVDPEMVSDDLERQLSEELIRIETQENTRQEAAEKAREEAEEKARLEASDELERQLAEELVQLEIEERARLEAAEKERLEAEDQAKQEAAEKAREEAEEKARLEASNELERQLAKELVQLETEEREEAERIEELDFQDTLELEQWQKDGEDEMRSKALAFLSLYDDHARDSSNIERSSSEERGALAVQDSSGQTKMSEHAVLWKNSLSFCATTARPRSYSNGAATRARAHTASVLGAINETVPCSVVATSDGALRALERLPSRRMLDMSAPSMQPAVSSQSLDSTLSEEIIWISDSFPSDKPFSLQHEMVADEFSMWSVDQTIDPAVARKEGFLLVKQGTVEAPWIKQYVILKYGMLSFFDEKIRSRRQRPRHTIPLKGSLARVQLIENNDEISVIITQRDSSGTLYLMGKNEEQIREWLVLLEACILVSIDLV